MASFETRYDELSKRVEQFTYSPTSLNECVNTATTEYSNFIKTKGTPVVMNGQTSFSMSEQEWKKANSDYEAAKVNCETQFGKQ